MTRMTWMAVVMLGCQSQPVPEVSLGGAPFEVKDAVFFSTVAAFGLPSTFVVFGAQTELCRAFEDERNVCNARIAPDVHDGVIGALSRPVGVSTSLGWLTLRSGAEGAAVVVPDQIGLSTPGAALTVGGTPVVRSSKNRVVIEYFLTGDSATVAFESELVDGRPFRGRVEASWCPALDMVRRHNAGLGSGTRATRTPTFALVAQCGGESIEERCHPGPDGTEDCTCLRAGTTSTCTVKPDASRPRQSCCTLRFGE